MSATIEITLRDENKYKIETTTETKLTPKKDSYNLVNNGMAVLLDDHYYGTLTNEMIEDHLARLSHLEPYKSKFCWYTNNVHSPHDDEWQNSKYFIKPGDPRYFLVDNQEENCFCELGFFYCSIKRNPLQPIEHLEGHLEKIIFRPHANGFDVYERNSDDAFSLIKIKSYLGLSLKEFIHEEYRRVSSNHKPYDARNNTYIVFFWETDSNARWKYLGHYFYEHINKTRAIAFLETLSLIQTEYFPSRITITHTIFKEFFFNGSFNSPLVLYLLNRIKCSLDLSLVETNHLLFRWDDIVNKCANNRWQNSITEVVLSDNFLNQIKSTVKETKNHFNFRRIQAHSRNNRFFSYHLAIAQLVHQKRLSSDVANHLIYFMEGPKLEGTKIVKLDVRSDKLWSSYIRTVTAHTPSPKKCKQYFA